MCSSSHPVTRLVCVCVRHLTPHCVWELKGFPAAIWRGLMYSQRACVCTPVFQLQILSLEWEAGSQRVIGRHKCRSPTRGTMLAPCYYGNLHFLPKHTHTDRHKCCFPVLTCVMNISVCVCVCAFLSHKHFISMSDCTCLSLQGHNTCCAGF